eukprot:TRINITY_DN1707_c0_g1_i1.p1 TRINITY_DN1707_c0_g1~~TRINITY_DN1707_c0_g1_i1.p1  ORF type:complete len:582 (+),score=129.39 TRINITY_DN1707_c0_g1_i1:60-1748(+)
MDKIKSFFGIEKDDSEQEVDNIIVTEDQDSDFTIVDGWIKCRCGRMFKEELHYQYHCEATNGGKCPFPVSNHHTGWALRTFDFIPYVNDCQSAIIDHGKQHGIFVTLKFAQEFDDAGVRQVLSEIPAKTQRVMEAYETPIVSVIGVENKMWRRWDSNPPVSLHSFKERRAGDSGEVVLPASDEDMFLFVKCDRIDLCNSLTSEIIWALEDCGLESHSQTIGFVNMPTTGFSPNQGRDLTGFVDGTRNPDHLLRAVVDQTLIFGSDDESNHVGGSFMYAGKYIHNLRKFHAMNNEEKSNIIGRDYSVVQAHVGYDKRAENARLDNDEYRNRGARDTPAPNRYHTNRGHASIYRQAMPFISGDEQGLYFIAFARTIDEFDLVLDRMSGKFQEDGTTDALFDISKAVTSNYYYCPSLRELQDLPNVEVIENPDLGEDIETENEGPNLIFEVCTNCGYKTIALDIMKVIKRVCPEVNVLLNPVLPRLACFELYAEDGTILFSKLAKPDGMNNMPYCFPSHAEIETALREYFNMEPREDYTDEEKAYPTWGLTNWEFQLKPTGMCQV